MPQSRRRGVLKPLQDFLATEVAGATLLLVAAVVALIWANAWPDTYTDFWSHHPPIGGSIFDLSMQGWVNEVAMTLFFFVVGLEIKREVTAGELKGSRAVALPVVAALGGMVIPAAIYFSINVGGVGAEGWGIPMATDIAFAIAILTIAGRGLPARLRAFLLTLAIADDIGAILVIALVYSASIGGGWLLAMGAGVGVMVLLRRLPVQVHWSAYVVLGAFIWFATYRAGIHPTIAGVILGLGVPNAPLPRLEHRLHPLSSFLVVPLFALANAGIVLRTGDLGGVVTSPVFIGVFIGLVVGKIVGVAGATYLGSRLGLGPMPGPGGAVLGVAAVAGIGFTVSLFVAELAFADQGLVDAAKFGILAASVVAGGLGAALLRRARRRAVSPSG